MFYINNMVGDWILDCGSLMICFEMSAMIMKQRTSCAGKYNVVVLVCVCERGVCFLILLLLLGIIYLFDCLSSATRPLVVGPLNAYLIDVMSNH